MKYLLTGLGLLAVCVALCLSTMLLLDNYTEAASAQLKTAMEQADGGDYAAAVRTVQAAQEGWKTHRGFFGIMLRHDEADEVNAAFRALVQYAKEESDEEFLPNCSELMERVNHLAEMERPSYFNIL